jgi:hypothetical protein
MAGSKEHHRTSLSRSCMCKTNVRESLYRLGDLAGNSDPARRSAQTRDNSQSFAVRVSCSILLIVYAFKN